MCGEVAPAPSETLSPTGAVMSLGEQKLKAQKRLGQCSGELTLHFSAPVFQLRFRFPSAETTEMSGRCVVALATGEEAGELVTRKGLEGLQGGGSQFWVLAQEVVEEQTLLFSGLWIPRGSECPI